MKGTEVDVKPFLAERDLLLESTRSELHAALSPAGMMACDSSVQSEKKNMKVAVPSLRVWITNFSCHGREPNSIASQSDWNLRSLSVHQNKVFAQYSGFHCFN
jgi:hypothetical protein